jgi:hypothetical protein
MDAIERLKEELDLFSPEQPMITVSRKDLETLIKQYENLQQKLEKSGQKKA